MHEVSFLPFFLWKNPSNVWKRTQYFFKFGIQEKTTEWKKVCCGCGIGWLTTLTPSFWKFFWTFQPFSARVCRNYSHDTIWWGVRRFFLLMLSVISTCRDAMFIFLSFVLSRAKLKYTLKIMYSMINLTKEKWRMNVD